MLIPLYLDQNNDVITIAGVICGSLAGLIIIILIGIYYYRKSNRKIINDLAVSNEYVSSIPRPTSNSRHESLEMPTTNEIPGVRINSRLPSISVTDQMTASRPSLNALSGIIRLLVLKDTLDNYNSVLLILFYLYENKFYFIN